MESIGNESRLDELNKFAHELLEYSDAVRRYAHSEKLTETQKKRAAALYLVISKKVGYLGSYISELSGITSVDVDGKDYDIWLIALKMPADKLADSALGVCLLAINKAIGKLEDDIKQGKRDPNTGERIEVISTKLDTSIRPKAFIAHEGETRALTMLKEFLEAFGIHYFIAESKASGGRSIERQVDWTQSEADFAICLATKGKAINKKTGKHYMAPNIIDELGRARQVFGNKIILLVQKGVEVHTNIREIVYETFTTTNMERAFIKIVKELTNWGFITVGITKEHKS